MKLNKEKVYDFIRVYAAGNQNAGISTSEVAEALNMQRTNASSILNQLVEEGRIDKSNGRPVLYYVNAAEQEDCFRQMTGQNGSLKHVIQRAKAAVLYPQKSLNCILVGGRGTGKNYLAERMHRFGIEQGVFPEGAPYVKIACSDYREEEEGFLKELSGEGRDTLWNRTQKGVLYFENAQYLSAATRRRLLSAVKENEKHGMILVSFTEKSQIDIEEYYTEFPILIELPSLAERPLTERLELLSGQLNLEAARIKRSLVVKADLMRCLLLYECESNYHQLKGDIKIGCANAYVREYKSTEDIVLYLSDFEHQVRKGFLRYRLHRKEIEELVPAQSVYRFDGTTVSVTEEKKATVYEKIDRKANVLNQTGLSEEEISMILSAEVEQNFKRYQNSLTQDVVNTEQLSVLVAPETIRLVEDFVKNAEQKLERRFAPSVFYGLCLHVEALLRREDRNRDLAKEQMTEIISLYKKEYLLAAEFAETLSEKCNRELPLEETVFLTMFLCYPVSEAPQTGKPVLLFAYYGNGVASAMAKAVAGLTQMDNVFAFEPESDKNSTEIYDSLKEYIVSIHQGKGVFVIYDSCFLGDMLPELEEELGIYIRPFPMQALTMGVELVRKTQLQSNPEEIYRQTIREMKYVPWKKNNYIVTLCTTGKGGAEELKRYIEQYGKPEQTEIIPLSVSDRDLLAKTFRNLRKNGEITCVVGTFDPQLYDIPFFSIVDVFGTKKEHLKKLFTMEKSAKEKIDYDGMFEYLEEQLQHVSMEKVRKLLPETMRQINKEIGELSLDTEVGLLVHMACLIDRLAGKEVSPVNPRKKFIMREYEKQFQTLLQIMKPLEKTFHIIVNDDEIANILMIIYQL